MIFIDSLYILYYKLFIIYVFKFIPIDSAVVLYVTDVAMQRYETQPKSK